MDKCVWVECSKCGVTFDPVEHDGTKVDGKWLCFYCHDDLVAKARELTEDNAEP